MPPGSLSRLLARTAPGLGLCALLAVACQTEAPVSAPPAATGGAAAANGWPEPDDAVLEQLASTLNFSLGTPSGAWVAPDGREIVFRRSGPRSFVADLYAFDVASGAERP